jgi:hypothetical protein
MKVKDLRALLAQVDQELDIAVVTDNSEYWGTLYGVAKEAYVASVQVNGPKKAGEQCFLIQRGY